MLSQLALQSENSRFTASGTLNLHASLTVFRSVVFTFSKYWFFYICLQCFDAVGWAVRKRGRLTGVCGCVVFTFCATVLVWH